MAALFPSKTATFSGRSRHRIRRSPEAEEQNAQRPRTFHSSDQKRRILFGGRLSNRTQAKWNTDSGGAASSGIRVRASTTGSCVCHSPSVCVRATGLGRALAKSVQPALVQQFRTAANLQSGRCSSDSLRRAQSTHRTHPPSWPRRSHTAQMRQPPHPPPPPCWPTLHNCFFFFFSMAINKS